MLPVAVSSWSIELAVSDDADAVRHVRDAAWLAAYVSDAHGVSVDTITRRLNNTRPGRMRELIDTAGVAGTGATHGFIVARSINGADVLGYATPRVDDTGRRWVGALYVRPLHWHRGVGAALLRAVLDWHAIDGGLSAVVYCHVVTYNDRARRFYARFGFVETGPCPPDEGARRIGAIELPLVELARA